MADIPSCTICHDPVSNERSIARLICGHFFHLDCIGSAFNISGVMQCPNCRRTENGEWRYANGDPNPYFDEEDILDDDEHLVQSEPSRFPFPPHVFPGVQFQIRGLSHGFHVQRPPCPHINNGSRREIFLNQNFSHSGFNPATNNGAFGQRSGIFPGRAPGSSSFSFSSPVPAPPQSVVRYHFGHQGSLENLPSPPVLSSLRRGSSSNSSGRFVSGQAGPSSVEDIGDDGYPVLSLGIPGSERSESERVVASNQPGPDGPYFRFL